MGMGREAEANELRKGNGRNFIYIGTVFYTRNGRERTDRKRKDMASEGAGGGLLLHHEDLTQTDVGWPEIGMRHASNLPGIYNLRLRQKAAR